MVALVLFVTVVLLLFLLIWLYFVYTDTPLPFSKQKTWKMLPEEQVAILVEKKQCAGLSIHNPMTPYVKLGYGIDNDEGDDRRQYLIPEEDIQQQLTVEIHNPVRRQPSPECELTETKLKRAISTDSLASTTSSLLELDIDLPTIHLVLSYDETSQMFLLEVQRMLYACGENGHIWLLFYLLPHPKPLWRTEAKMTPASVIEYNSLYQQCVRSCDLSKISLLVQMYSSKQQSACIIGQCRLRLKDIAFLSGYRKPLQLTLQPTIAKDETPEQALGDVLFFATYYDGYLTVVVSKVRNIPCQYRKLFIRVYLVTPMGKATKKKTSSRILTNGQADIGESVKFPVTEKKLLKSNLRISVVCNEERETPSSIGHITLGQKTSGKELGHWNRLIETPNNVAASWHSIQPRRTRSFF